jgi:phage-related tail protein
MASNIHMPSVGGSLSSNMSYMSEHSFATGTEFAPGGWSQINEHGGEIVDLPSGSRVYPAATTRKMLEKQLAGYGSTGAPSVTVTGNTFTVREDADIDKIAYKLARLISQGSINYGGGF